MRVAYLRSQGSEESVQSAMAALEAAGCDHLVVDSSTGSRPESRTALQTFLNHMKRGDDLVVTKLDQLATSLPRLVEFLGAMLDRGIAVETIPARGRPQAQTIDRDEDTRRPVLWLQGRTHRAGAQTCLARLLAHPAVRAWNPVLACSHEGWLSQETERLDVPSIITRFPSARSLPARLYGNVAWARRLAARLDDTPSIVHANDHQEGLYGLELARRLGSRSAIFLRSPSMTESDYFKYRCDRFDYVGAIGEELAARVRRWDPGRTIDVVHDGIAEVEFWPPKRRPAEPPKRILVIGSEAVWKGWADLVAALRRLEAEGALPPLAFDFTGRGPDAGSQDLDLNGLQARCRFLGRVEAFRDLVSGYDLVINPSRMETFGMAAVEVLAAGVPLLSSRTGIMGRIQKSKAMLFSPGRPDELAARLKNLLENWSHVDFGVAAAQEQIRSRFLIDHAAAHLTDVYEALTSARPRRRQIRETRNEVSKPAFAG